MRRESCPICRKTTDALFAPFCSRGCKDRDLLNWLGEAYRRPVDDEENDGETGLDSDASARL